MLGAACTRLANLSTVGDVGPEVGAELEVPASISSRSLHGSKPVHGDGTVGSEVVASQGHDRRILPEVT